MKTIVLAVLLAMLGCSDDSPSSPVADVGFDLAPLPDMSFDADDAEPTLLDLDVGKAGPFNTGYRLEEVVYEPTPGVSRKISVNIWYPTEDTEGPHPKYLKVVNDAVSFTDATVADPGYDGRFPVMVYSHGDRGFAATSMRLVHHFVSHGWVVVAPDHITNTAFDNVLPRPVALYHWRTQDISRALDVLEDIDGADPLAPADVSKVLMTGHSYGGFTCWPLAGATWDAEHIAEQCATSMAATECTPADEAVFAAGSRDARIVAAVPMAGTLSNDWFTPDAYTAVEVPVMTLTGTDDPIDQRALWDRISGIDYTWIDIVGACHQAFALGGCSEIRDEDADLVINSYSLTFGRRWVLGDMREETTNVLSGRTEVSLAALFLKKN